MSGSCRLPSAMVNGLRALIVRMMMDDPFVFDHCHNGSKFKVSERERE